MVESDPFGDKLPVLETERLVLRHPRTDDLENLFAAFSDLEAMRYWSSEPWKTRAEAEVYLASIHSGFADRSLFQWALTLKGVDNLIGTVTLAGWQKTNRRVELGYMLRREFWQQGLAAEAVRAALRFAFVEMNVHRVEAELDPRNLPSVRLLERFGFQEEGILRDRWFLYNEWSDSALYGLLTRDFERHKS